VSVASALISTAAAEFVASMVSLAADNRMKRAFSEFWHDVQPELRRALKQARVDAGGAEPLSREWRRRRTHSERDRCRTAVSQRA
jgi:hypothetical protein